MSRATTKRSSTGGNGYDDNDDSECIPDLLEESTSSLQGSFRQRQQNREWFRDEGAYASDRDILSGECKISEVDSNESGSLEETGQKLKDDNLDDDDLSIRRRSNKTSLWPLAGGGLTMASIATVTAYFAGGKGTASEVLEEDDLVVTANWMGSNAVSAWGTEGTAVPPPIGREVIATSQA